MKKVIPGISLLLAPLSALAQKVSEIPVPSPADANPTALIMCALLFVVMVGVFVAYLFIQGRKEEQQSGE